MKDMEILCRSSAFLVPVRNKEKFDKNFHVITCSHVVAPWRWPKFYANDWLKAVNESHTHYTIELRYPDGIFQTQIDLLPCTYHHKTRDLSILHVEVEDGPLKDLKDLGFDALAMDESELTIDERLWFYGHEVKGLITPEGVDMRVPIPYYTQVNACEICAYIALLLATD